MPDVLNWNQSRLGEEGGNATSGVNVRKDNIYRKSYTAEQRAPYRCSASLPTYSKAQ